MLFRAHRVMYVYAADETHRRAERSISMKTQTFGIEIETTGLGRQRTAEVIAKFFGTKRRRA